LHLAERVAETEDFDSERRSDVGIALLERTSVGSLIASCEGDVRRS